MKREDGEVHHRSRKHHHHKHRSRSRSRHRRSKPTEDPTLTLENKMIDEFMNAEQLLEKKRQTLNDLLSKYRLPEAQPPTSDSDSEDLPVKVILMEEQKLDIDVGRQNYLKMLESLRDCKLIKIVSKEEVVDKQEQEIVQPAPQKRVKKETFDMFEDDVEDSEEPEFTGDRSPERRVFEADDENRYYRAAVGELLGKDYRVSQTSSGKGVFANVVKAMQGNTEVAIKMLRNEEIYLRSGERERTILLKLNEQDKNQKSNVIRMLDSFEYRKHLCLVFESMDTNLRDFMRAKGKGLSLDVIRVFATNLFVALSFLRKQKIIHADIKPDNILITRDHTSIKLCDFGTAFSLEESSLVEYLQSRFYRAPEVIIGYPYDTQLDVWSTACTLYELYTAKFLFNGKHNNEMLKQQIQTMGKFSLKILKRGAFISKYFDQNFTFLSKEIDPVTKSEHSKPILLGEKPTRSLAQLLRMKEGSTDEQKKVLQFKDLLEKCLQLDPKNRMTPEEALQHPFLTK